MADPDPGGVTTTLVLKPDGTYNVVQVADGPEGKPVGTDVTEEFVCPQFSVELEKDDGSLGRYIGVFLGREMTDEEARALDDGVTNELGADEGTIGNN